jgi:transposase-like protein
MSRKRYPDELKQEAVRHVHKFTNASDRYVRIMSIDT